MCEILPFKKPDNLQEQWDYPRGHGLFFLVKVGLFTSVMVVLKVKVLVVPTVLFVLGDNPLSSCWRGDRAEV